MELNYHHHHHHHHHTLAAVSRKITPVTSKEKVGWPQNGSGHCGEKKTSCPCRDLNLNTSFTSHNPWCWGKYGAKVQWWLTEHCCPTATFSITNPNKNSADANPDLCGQKPITNRLSHVTTIYVLSNETYPRNRFKIRRAINTRMGLFRDTMPHTLVMVTKLTYEEGGSIFGRSFKIIEPNRRSILEAVISES
jgi:hypothetical protein